MSTNQSPFEVLLGRQPTEKEIQNLYRIKNTLQIQDNDALWLVLCALESYNTLYSQYPDKIKTLLDEHAKELTNQPTPKKEVLKPVDIGTSNPAYLLYCSGLFFVASTVIGACFLNLGYLMATSTSPFWYNSQNIFSNILKTPSGLLISFVCLTCALIPLFIHKNDVLKGKRLDLLTVTAIFLLLAILTFASVI